MLLALVGSRRVPNRAKLYELTGIPKETFSRYASRSRTGRRIPLRRAAEACKAVNLPFPYHRKRHRGRILVSDGDHEELVDALLFAWDSHPRRNIGCPATQIATVIFTRWESFGFGPQLTVRTPVTKKHSARVRATEFAPGLQYELMLDFTKMPGEYDLVRYSLDERAGKWLPSAAGNATLSGASLTEIDIRLKILQQELCRHSTADAESRLKRIHAFEESVTREFSKLQQPL